MKDFKPKDKKMGMKLKIKEDLVLKNMKKMKQKFI